MLCQGKAMIVKNFSSPIATFQGGFFWQVLIGGVRVDKVIDLLAYKESAGKRNGGCEMLDLEDTANTLCEEAWHLLVPMRMLKIRELTIDSTGSILNMKYQDDDSD